MEAYPHDTQGQKTSASFLYNGTRSLFEQVGFTFERSKGQKNTVMTKTVPPSEDGAELGQPCAVNSCWLSG